MRLLVCLSFLATTLSFHDHNFHPSASSIRAEARRAAYNDFDDLVNDIQVFRNTLLRMKDDYEKLLTQSGHKTNLHSDMWEQNYGNDYRRRYDNYLIIQHVCEDMYNSTLCNPSDPWTEALDIRKRQFHEEFVAEIHKEIQGDIRKIKMWKKQREDL